MYCIACVHLSFWLPRSQFYSMWVVYKSVSMCIYPMTSFYVLLRCHHVRYDVQSDDHAAFATIVHKLDAELVRGMHAPDHPKKYGHNVGMMSRMYGDRHAWEAVLATAGFVQVAETETSGTYGCYHALFQKRLPAPPTKRPRDIHEADTVTLDRHSQRPRHESTV